MKKIFALVVVALVGLSAAFSFDVGEIKGTWKDANWNANWTVGADTNGKGQIVLTDATTGVVYKKFNDSNVSGFKYGLSTDGASISFYCAETGRKYTFTKPISLGNSLKLSIDRDWTDEPYDVTITWTTGDVGFDGNSAVDATKNAIGATKDFADDVNAFANGLN